MPTSTLLDSRPWSFGLSLTRRTAGCGPACPLVWQGKRGDSLPYADCARRFVMIILKIVLPNALTLALVSAAVLGFRHAFDYDHIAAISDITSVEPSRRN